MQVEVRNETSLLKSVILGIANSVGPIPTAEQAYDPKSLENILNGTYPEESDMICELEAFEAVLKKHAVEVIRPRNIPELNQIFTRDIGFVIDDVFFKANILPDRADEWAAISGVVKLLDPKKLVVPPPEVHVEGGDVMLWNDYLFVGTYLGKDYPEINTARTNTQAVEFLREFFPRKKVLAFDLVKSTIDPRANALHLDCCFQPVGADKGIIFEGGFRNPKDYQQLVDLFGKENLFHINSNEMYAMFSNVFSISPEVIVSEKDLQD